MTIVVGLDPGKLRGTGAAVCSFAGQKRKLAYSWSGIYSAHRIVTDITNTGAEIAAIETMRAMGPMAGLQKILDNAQFVGELVGRLEAAGVRVVQLDKLTILRGLGIKGKAPAGRVRKVVASVFGMDLPKRFTDHEVDAMAVAYVGSRMAAQPKATRAGRKA
jgi:Holliday junction resolvasome RuvABC endonuclease subunit